MYRTVCVSVDRAAQLFLFSLVKRRTVLLAVRSPTQNVCRTVFESTTLSRIIERDLSEILEACSYGRRTVQLILVTQHSKKAAKKIFTHVRHSQVVRGVGSSKVYVTLSILGTV